MHLNLQHVLFLSLACRPSYLKNTHEYRWMFVMLFIYVVPFNYSFVYLFMEELTEIGKFIFAEGHLAPLYPIPTQRKGLAHQAC